MYLRGLASFGTAHDAHSISCCSYKCAKQRLKCSASCPRPVLCCPNFWHVSVISLCSSSLSKSPWLLVMHCSRLRWSFFVTLLLFLLNSQAFLLACRRSTTSSASSKSDSKTTKFLVDTCWLLRISLNDCTQCTESTTEYQSCALFSTPRGPVKKEAKKFSVA